MLYPVKARLIMFMNFRLKVTNPLIGKKRFSDLDWKEFDSLLLHSSQLIYKKDV